MDWRTFDKKLPPEALARLHDRRAAMVTEVKAKADAQGKLMFEGELLTPEEVKRAYARLRRRGWAMSLELMLTLLAMLIGVIIVTLMLAFITGI